MEEDVFYEDNTYRVVRSDLGCIDVWDGDYIIFCSGKYGHGDLGDLPEKIQNVVIKEVI